jgi:DNA repair protein RadC
MLAETSSLKKERSRDVDIVKVMLVKDGNSPYRIKNVKKPRDIAAVARDFLIGEDREVFIAINLDGSNKINSVHVVAIGSANATLVHPREIFKAAILSNAVAIVLAHNHPSGNPNPSDDDQTFTCKLFECGDILGIKVLDHVVIGENQYSHCFVSHEKDGKKRIAWLIENFEDEKDGLMAEKRKRARC